MTSQTLSLNLIPKGVCPRLYVSQYDKGQEWNFDIYAGTEAYTIPSGSSVTIQGTKPDKTGFQYACSFSGNIVTATEQQQMTIIAGEVPAEIRIEKNNEIIATLNFIIVVEKAALADDTVISETDLPLIEEAIEVLGHADELVSQIQGYATTAQNAASTATTKASHASTSATNASNSATTASNAATTATNKASEATSAASTATTKAGEASTSATSAAGSASTATTKAQEAAASAAAAAQSAAHLTIDSTMSTTSENALQNKVVTSAIQNLSNLRAEMGAHNKWPLSLDAIKSINNAAYHHWTGNVCEVVGAYFTVTNESIAVSGTPSSNVTFTIGRYRLEDLGIRNGDIVSSEVVDVANKYKLVAVYRTDSVYIGEQSVFGQATLEIPNNCTVIDLAIVVYGSITVPSGLVYKPMIRDAKDTDPTYQPYAKTNQQLTQETTGLIDNQNVNGAVNMVPINLTTQVDGIYSYTVAADKTISTVVSSATSLTLKVISPVFTLKAGTYKLSGTPVMSGSTADLQLMYSDDSAVIATEYNNQGKVFTLATKASVKLRIIWHSNVAPGTYVFKPMIAVPSYTGDYVPYAKSNYELTEDVAKLTIKTATFSANTGANGIVASGIPEAKAPKCIPISVSFTSTAPPPCVGFEYNNSYGSWYIRCKSWDGSLRQNSDVAGTISYIDLN